MNESAVTTRHSMAFVGCQRYVIFALKYSTIAYKKYIFETSEAENCNGITPVHFCCFLCAQFVNSFRQETIIKVDVKGTDRSCAGV